MSNSTTLLQKANQTGLISAESLQAFQVPDIGQQIQNALGISVDDVTTSEVILVTQLIDDSGSIRMVPGNTEAVRVGHNAVLDDLSDAKSANGILAHTRYLNRGSLFDFTLLKDAVRMDKHNFNPTGGTPLYDQIAITLGTVVAKVQEFDNNNVPVRAITLIVTDGDDTGSHQSARSLKPLVEDLLRSEMHIVAGMGIYDGRTDFRRIFNEIGIPDEWILTPKNTPSEIRAAFQLFSQSAVRASRGIQSFSNVAGGGFNQP